MNVSMGTIASFISDRRVIVSAIVFAALFFWQYAVPDFSPFQERWSPCLDYLKEGDLYGGQGHCVNGPVHYLLLSFIRNAFPGHYQFATHAFDFLLYALLFLLLVYSLSAERQQYSFWLLLVLYGSFFILLAGQDSDAVLSTLFFFGGLIVLLSSLWKPMLRWLVSGLLFALSVHTKMNLLFYVGMVLGFFFLFRGVSLRDGRVRIERGALQCIGVILGVLVFVTVVFLVVFPQVLSYTFLIHLDVGDDSGPASFSLSRLTSSFSNLYVAPFVYYFPGLLHRLTHVYAETFRFVFFSIFYFIVSFLLFWRHRRDRSIHHAFAFFGYLLFFLIYVPRWGSFGFRFFLPLFPSFLIAIVTESSLHHERRNSQVLRGFLLFVVGIMVFSTIMMARYSLYTTTPAFQDFQGLVGSGFTLLPKNFTYLTDSIHLFRLAGFNLSETAIEQYPQSPPYHEHQDPALYELLQRHGVLNEYWRNYNNIPTAGKLAVVEKLIRHDHDAIVIGDENYFSPLFQLLIQIRQGLESKQVPYASVMQYDCGVMIPTTKPSCEGCLQPTLVYFRDQTVCEQMRIAVAMHYYRKFDAICLGDSFVANHIVRPIIYEDAKTNATMTNAFIAKQCKKGFGVYQNSTATGIANSQGDFFLLLSIVGVSIITSFSSAMRISGKKPETADG